MTSSSLRSRGKVFCETGYTLWQVYQMSAIGILLMMQLEKGGGSLTKSGLLGSGVLFIQQNNSRKL